MEKRFIGVAELAEYLDMKKQTIYSWTFQRKIPYFKVGRIPKFDLQEIDKWLQKRKVKVLL